METKFRCACPFTSALDVVGDKWTLVIVKQMLVEGKRTFKDFLESDEAIATNILSSRLKMLEDSGMLTKQKLPDNKKTNIYRLTDKGLSLTPILIELALWSDGNLRDLHPDLTTDATLEVIKADKEKFGEMLVNSYKAQSVKD
jgi:DNA-binding HxlR family transcriptional regulator